jgi:hypothetical protein
MNQRTVYSLIGAVLAFILALTSLNWRAHANPATQQPPPEDKLVEQVRKNIQALKGMPDSQLLPVMHIMRTSLGVRCDYCHVAENSKYWMDDKPTKQIARKMLQMVFDINKNNFGGKTVVSCNSCHRGNTKPLAIPAIGQGAFTNTTSDDAPKLPESLPTVDQVVDKYVQALGGKAAIDKIKTRSTRVTLLRPKLINYGTTKAAILNRAETWTIETFQKAPDKYLAVITAPDEVILQGFNGTTGWIKSASELREMDSAEVARIRRQADLYKDTKLKEQYSKMSVTGKVKIGNREMYMIRAQSWGSKTEDLFFDVQSGLLIRRTVFTETKLGLDPEQTDYEDYRVVDGAWLPFRVRVSYLDDNHYGTTRKLNEVKQNIPIGDARFQMP